MNVMVLILGIICFVFGVVSLIFAIKVKEHDAFAFIVILKGMLMPYLAIGKL